MKLFTAFLLTCTAIFANPFDFKTISSDFSQTITNEENSKIVYTGRFYATTDAKALWIYKTPLEKRIYFSKNQVVIIEPELEQAIITNLNDTPNLTEILKSAKKIDKNIYEASYSDTKYTILVKGGYINTISYKDQLENSVVIELSNQTTNIFLDVLLFAPTIPDNFDVIRQ